MPIATAIDAKPPDAAMHRALVEDVAAHRRRNEYHHQKKRQRHDRPAARRAGTRARRAAAGSRAATPPIASPPRAPASTIAKTMRIWPQRILVAVKAAPAALSGAINKEATTSEQATNGNGPS